MFPSIESPSRVRGAALSLDFRVPLEGMYMYVHTIFTPIYYNGIPEVLMFGIYLYHMKASMIFSLSPKLRYTNLSSDVCSLCENILITLYVTSHKGGCGVGETTVSFTRWSRAADYDSALQQISPYEQDLFW